MTTVFHGVDELRAGAGRHLGFTDWVELTPARVEQFAAATGEPAGGSGDGASGYLVLAMTNELLPRLLEVRDITMGVNYGTGEVRFPAHAATGSRVRAGAEIVAAEAIAGGVQTVIRITVEVEGGDEPACVVDAISRWLG